MTRHLSVFAALLLAVCVPAIQCFAATPQEDVQRLDQLVVQADHALDAGNLDEARQTYQRYRDGWVQIEDGVNAVDPQQYQAIEVAQREVRLSLQTQPFDASRAAAALDKLHASNVLFIASGSPETGVQAGQLSIAATDAERLQAAVAQLDSARTAIARKDTAAALAALRGFQIQWPSVEVTVKAKSPSAYAATEDDMASAEAMLSGAQPRDAEADAVLARMRDRLAPFAESGTNYGLFDAWVIMLREGLEALLVVGALTAFVKRSNNSDKQSWIWGGALVGIVLSVGLAVVLQQVFSRAGAGLGREVVEGSVGLFAAAMLFYVSYWLHSKSKLGAWQSYIRERGTAALAGGSMLSLSLVALLAVLREGAETAIFYLGIAPSIAPSDLVLGLGLGVLSLAGVGVAVMFIGLRLPLRPFFIASSLLIYYLGFKFLGTGLHALQVAGVLPATPAPVPSSDVLGVYPTWETALPQLVLVLAAVAIVWLSLRGQRSATPAATA
jgi:high-affinity iron transporter